MSFEAIIIAGRGAVSLRRPESHNSTCLMTYKSVLLTISMERRSKVKAGADPERSLCGTAFTTHSGHHWGKVKCRERSNHSADVLTPPFPSPLMRSLYLYEYFQSPIICPNFNKTLGGKKVIFKKTCKNKLIPY